MPISCDLTVRKILILSSSGGGGLIQAANAKEQEIKAKDPSIAIVRQDIMKDWLGERIGKFCVNGWNQAQMNGNVAIQSFFVGSQFLADIIFWPQIFFCALKTLFRENIDHIIDTQPIGTSAILTAIRIFNRRRGKKVLLEKVVVDLPTKKATHFFSPVKRLSKNNRRYLKLTTIAPLLENGETAEEFWMKNCGLSEKEIHYEDFYIRQAFRKYQGVPRIEEKGHLKIRYKNEEELTLCQKAFKRGMIQGKVQKNEIEFQIGPEDRLVTVLLGSHPSQRATFAYVKNFLEAARHFHYQSHCFVFCADHTPGEQTLFKKVADWIEGLENYPKHCSIVPFSFQNDDIIAPLFFRSQITCTRSGGQTAMELMCVSRGEIWIHSETKYRENLTLEERLKGIPGWEAANALYLKKMYGAEIVTPEMFGLLAQDVLKSNQKKFSPKIECIS